MGSSSRYGKTKTTKRRGFCKRTYASAKNKVQEHKIKGFRQALLGLTNLLHHYKTSLVNSEVNVFTFLGAIKFSQMLPIQLV